MDDELREKIAVALLNTDDSKKDETYREHKLRQADAVLSLLAPVIKNAEMWERVKEIADSTSCEECPFDKRNGYCTPCAVEILVDALEKESKEK